MNTRSLSIEACSGVQSCSLPFYVAIPFMAGKLLDNFFCSNNALKTSPNIMAQHFGELVETDVTTEALLVTQSELRLLSDGLALKQPASLLPLDTFDGGLPGCRSRQRRLCTAATAETTAESAKSLRRARPEVRTTTLAPTSISIPS